MNFQQLEYVIAVDQLKHFARAAESCHVTQATLSAMIRKLEEETGITIFDRSRHPVVTTDEGKELIEEGKQILFHRNKILQIKDDHETELEGEIKIGIIPTIANSLLPIILPELLKTYPKLHLNCTEITTDEIIAQLKSDKIDVGILATPLNDDLLEEDILYYEAMMVYGVDEKRKKFIPTKAVQNQNIWLLEEGNCFRNQTATICNIKEKSGAPKNLTFEGSSFETLLNLTDQFGGYTLIPELYYKTMSKEKKVRTRLFEKPLPVREISMVYYRPFARQKSIAKMAEFIRQLVPDQLLTSKYKAKDLDIIGI